MQRKEVTFVDGFVLPAKLPRGRPKKSPLHEETDEDDGQRAKRGAVLSFEEPSSKRERGMYDKWRRDPDMFALLKAAVINASRTGKNYCTPALLIHIPRTTMGQHKAAFEAAAKQHSIPLADVTCQMVFPKAECGGGRAPLLTADDCKFLTDIAISRDLRNNGMTRSEIITMVMELSQSGSRQQAKNHYDHLVRKGKLSGLKRGGRVVTAQKTTTKRSQITVEQQLRWHTAVDFALAGQKRLNLPAEKFDEIKEHFFCNMDESSLLASDGTVRVIGTASKSKTEKIMEDCRASITVLQTGAAGGFSGPWIFLAVGKEKITCRALRSIDTMPDVPPNSKVYMTPSAYMTDSVYAEIVPQLADSIRRMPHICNHPEWWVIVSLDGFGSHVNVHEAQAAFFERKIMILKEEGDTSHLKSGVRPVCGKERQGRDANEP
jgi:hypothetical protein